MKNRDNYKTVNRYINNKKLTLLITLLLAQTLMLVGCSAGESLRKVSQYFENEGDTVVSADDNQKVLDDYEGASSEIKVYSTEGLQITPQIDVVEYDDSGVAEDGIKASDIVNNHLLHAYNNDCYGYNSLSLHEKETYIELYSVLAEVRDNVELTTTDKDEIEKAFNFVMKDHPELFYVKGYTIGLYSTGDKVSRIEFGGNYILSKPDIEAKKTLVEAYITNVIKNAPAGDDYEKVKYVYEYIVNNTRYDLDAENNQNILSVIENGASVCKGYAYIMQLILERMNIFCTTVTGQAVSSYNGANDSSGNNLGPHAWNVVRVNGNYYNLDATWGDKSSENADFDYIQYEYMLINDEDISDTHFVDETDIKPICSEVTDYYCYREKCYFDSVDEERLKTVFDKAYENDNSLVYLKLMNADVLNEMNEYLFKNEHVFDYCRSNSIQYMTDRDNRWIIIVLDKKEQ